MKNPIPSLVNWFKDKRRQARLRKAALVLAGVVADLSTGHARTVVEGAIALLQVEQGGE